MPGKETKNRCETADRCGTITRLWRQAQAGEARALDDVAVRVYPKLVAIANKLLFGMYAKRLEVRSLDAAAVVHETFVRLRNQREPFRNRTHLFCIAKRIIDRVIQDYLKYCRRKRHGGDRKRTGLSTPGRLPPAEPDPGTLVVRRAFEELAKHDSRAARVGVLHVLEGRELAEIAKELAVSRSTVDRDWRFARRWFREWFRASK